MADESAKPMDVLSEEDIVNALANVIHDKLLSALEGGADEEAVKQATEIKPDDAFKVLPDILNLLAPEVPVLGAGCRHPLHPPSLPRKAHPAGLLAANCADCPEPPPAEKDTRISIN
eukprot:Hpha_TRINITY_DN14144_c0_g1::TRINITY_DN14144_c0_g1_i1::g.10530::m.10530